MPELPDLEVFSSNLTKKLCGKKLKKLEISYTKKIKTPVKKFRQALEGQKLVRVYRDGKELRFVFTNDNILGLHLMLHGNLYLFEKAHEKKYPIIELYFSDHTGLVMTDFQGQAAPTLNPPEKPGVDALSKEVNFKFLKTLMSKSRSSIKKLLMDQKHIRGIGNAYADEILWDARISPFSVSNKIPDPAIKKLLQSIRKVLAAAQKKIIQLNPDIITGEERSFMKIHNRKKTHSPTGGKILVDAGTRKTYYTSEQELFG